MPTPHEPAEGRPAPATTAPFARRLPSRTAPLPAAIGAASALLLGACSPQAPAVVQPTTTPTRTVLPTSPTTESTTTPAPEPAPEPTSTLPTRRSDSSWEVVEAFFDAYTHGLQTGDSSRLKALSSITCASCASMAAEIDALETRDVVGEGGAVTFPKSAGHASPHPERYVWEILYRQAPVKLRLTGPVETTTTDATSAVALVELTVGSSGWRVSGISHSDGGK